ncbi:Zinc finger protein [Quillaja saponaria]|uniref:Zinc finger protein n=1 Tax=Quillaja saponaria TaxID=32244 RepID=A0AAD7L3N5_QUISA|nr:Zinc finger protein [Quillaja saponaria]
MNPSKTEDDLFLHHHHNHNHHDLGPPSEIIPHQIQSQPSISNPPDDPSFSLPEIVLFRSSSSESPSHSSTDSPTRSACHPPSSSNNNLSHQPLFVSPEPHISSQFYTFNLESHALMMRCIMEHRLATPAEIRAATPRAVLKSWRAVWKDRNEETAYITAWKRIQDKLTAHIDENGNEFLCFKNNSQQFVSHINQWQDIVMSFHGDTDLKHLGLKETIERIKQVWTVGAKFYGIPESYIRVCVSACPVCSAATSESGGRNKRRRFEYTESFDVPAKEVPHKLQQLAAKHKVVLCIRQKYIRYKPFMAEVKDYACHRAGEPAAKKSKILKREPYASKRCGCGFRIRAIVPITNYNEKDKTFVYQEEGMAVFKLYAVHSGHEPGPLDGNARIMHRVVGHKGGYLMDQETLYGVSEDMENDSFGLMGKDEGDFHFSVLHQVQELRAEVGLLEGRISKLPLELMGSVSRDLFDIVNKIRNIGEEGLKPMGLLSHNQQADDVLVGDNDLAHWSDHHHERMYVNGKDTELIEDDDDSFGRTLGDVVSWDQMRTDCRSHKDLLSESCKPEKWLKCSDFDEKSLLECEDTKLTKPIRHDEAIVTDVGLGPLGCIQVDSFYQENPKWYDSPCGLDTGADCGDSEVQHGEIL